MKVESNLERISRESDRSNDSRVTRQKDFSEQGSLLSRSRLELQHQGIIKSDKENSMSESSLSIENRWKDSSKSTNQNVEDEKLNQEYQAFREIPQNNHVSSEEASLRESDLRSQVIKNREAPSSAQNNETNSASLKQLKIKTHKPTSQNLRSFNELESAKMKIEQRSENNTIGSGNLVNRQRTEEYNNISKSSITPPPLDYMEHSGLQSSPKGTSLPTIDSKNKKPNNGMPSPSQIKTELPAIESNKYGYSTEKVMEQLGDDLSKQRQTKTLSLVSSPHVGQKREMGATSSSSSSNRVIRKASEENTSKKQAENRATQAGKVVPKEPVQAKVKSTTLKPSAPNKTVKGSDFPQIPDEDIVDYSNFIQSFQHLFSGAWLSNNFDYLGVMRDFHRMFTVHTESVDNMESLLSKYKPSIAPLELGPNDMIAQNNINHVLMYSTKTNIDLRVYLERQQIFNKNVSLMQYGQDAGDSDTTIQAKDTLYYRVVKTKSEVYDIVTRSFLRKKNWVELPHGMNLKTTWNLLWTWGKPQIDMTKLLVFQKVNHFPGNKGIVRKDLLKSNIERIQKLGNKAAAAFNILPATFVLPKEINKFIEVFYENHEKEGIYNIWIIKPVGSSRGRGISLMNDIGGLNYTETIVAQKYLKNPLLLNGFKFDMRIYVLVTSMNPLEVFIYKEGFARLSTVAFNLNVADLQNLFIHLTNSSVQKNSGMADNNTSDAIVGGTKISLKTLRQRLERKGIPWVPIWNQVCEIVVKALYACQNDVSHHPNAFELFGYDIIIDTDLKCWLIEVNSSPSLGRMNILDDLIKQQLIDDIIDLLSPVQFDRTRLVQVLERRILEEQRLKSNINTMNNSKVQLNKDLTYILHGKKIREVGETPANMGNFEKIAPSEMSDRLHKLIQSYKVQYKTPMQQDDKKQR